MRERVSAFVLIISMARSVLAFEEQWMDTHLHRLVFYEQRKQALWILMGCNRYHLKDAKVLDACMVTLLV